MNAASMHLLVRLHASPDSPDTVAAHYASAPEAQLSAPRRYAFGEDGRVSVHAPGETYPGCGVEPNEDDRSVIVVSRAVR